MFSRSDAVHVTAMLVVLGSAGLTLASGLVIIEKGGATELSLNQSQPFHTTTSTVLDARVITVPGFPVWGAVWTEQAPSGEMVPFYALSFDGVHVDRVRRVPLAARPPVFLGQKGTALAASCQWHPGVADPNS